MKRFLLFAGGYFKSGGWNDFMGDFDTLEAALAHQEGEWPWRQVVDTVTREMHEKFLPLKLDLPFGENPNR